MMSMREMFKFKTLKEQYEELILSKLFPDRKIEFVREELTDNEKMIIEFTYELFQEKMDDMKILKDEITRVSIENANLKSFNDNKDYYYDNDKYDEDVDN
jgi:hypothetical protein